MKQNITLALHDDGSSTLIHGTEVPFADQRATVQELRDKGLSEGVKRVEIWTRTCVKFAHQQASQMAAAAEAEAAALATKAASLAAKLAEDAQRHAAEEGAQAK